MVVISDWLRLKTVVKKDYIDKLKKNCGGSFGSTLGRKLDQIQWKIGFQWIKFSDSPSCGSIGSILGIRILEKADQLDQI